MPKVETYVLLLCCSLALVRRAGEGAVRFAATLPAARPWTRSVPTGRVPSRPVSVLQGSAVGMHPASPTSQVLNGAAAAMQPRSPTAVASTPPMPAPRSLADRTESAPGGRRTRCHHARERPARRRRGAGLPCRRPAVCVPPLHANAVRTRESVKRFMAMVMETDAPTELLKYLTETD